MDALGRIYPAASELLSISDGLLARHGAPDGHEVLALLRQTGRLPGDFAAAMADWHPAVLLERASLTRAQSGRLQQVSAELTQPYPWQGPAASALSARLHVASRQASALGSTAAATASALTELAAWLTQARLRLARALAITLTSTEAVTLKSVTGQPLSRAEAAARISVVVLREAESVQQASRDFAAHWPKPADPRPIPAPQRYPADTIRVEGLI
jgi:hypothetical protein